MICLNTYQFDWCKKIKEQEVQKGMGNGEKGRSVDQVTCDGCGQYISQREEGKQRWTITMICSWKDCPTFYMKWVYG